ncbi:OmpA family protein [Bacillus hwajinpoensis]|uniref:OmpA family protein n=1 Tax=Guptibacillus hwajinpoensis TaxID=208199 RepID=A0A845EWQ1_9BACL|nr:MULTISPECIES: OmpA family protein [Bacillaceae]MCA0992837.1 OmpA family protein [Pseudalkalibacillus hwajinpoensis]MYL62972.1 OmpA family protein [Pseudalkalibacillus hwajinpoensis]PFG14026.1 chemotaxis protein MotB [Bacillus sp. es.036]
MKNRKRRFQIQGDEEHYWPSFADMMAMIVLVMLFIAIIAFVQMIYDAYDQTVMKQELAKVADVKKHISDLIEEQLEENVGKDKIVRGPNNTISVEGDILFDTGSAEISEEGKRVLNDLADVFANLIDEEDISQYLYIILIEGHTDKVPYDNWKLSADRSVAVVKELMKANPKLNSPEYAKYLAATGYSEYKPVVEEDTNEAYEKNRRISFQIILDDEKWQGRLKEIMTY